MQIVLDLAQEILKVFWQMSPYLFLGFTISGVLHVFFSADFIVKHLGKDNLASVVKASVLGVPIPLCSCGVIPTAFSLRKNKASKGATVSFLVSTPQTGVDSIIATYGILGPIFALFRPVVSFLTGILSGALVNVFGSNDPTPTDASEVSAPTCCHDQEQQSIIKEQRSTISKKLKECFNYAYIEFMDDISLNLTVGVIIAGIISYIIPPDFFSSFQGNELLSMLLMIIAGVPLYICATSSIPVASALILKGLSPGAAFVFLAVGPATNAATMTMIWNSLGKKVFWIYLSVIVGCSTLAGLFLNSIYKFKSIDVVQTISHAGHSSSGSLLVNVISSVFLLLLLASFARKILNKFKKI